MTENPYQSPKPELRENQEPEHRSFRLTKNPHSDPPKIKAVTLLDAIVFTLIQQIPLLLLSALILDGGLILKRVAIASVAFWMLTLNMIVRRGTGLPDSDRLLIKWGFFPILLVTCILWSIASRI